MIHSLVIGGTRGIGREVVKLFSCQGHTVSVVSRRNPENEESSEAVRYWPVDIVDEQQRQKTMEDIVRQGKLNNLVFCQRYRGDDDPWIGEIENSLNATKRIIEKLSQEFLEGAGSIVFTGSIASCFIANEQPVGYHVAKAGQLQMCRYYAVLLGKQGIRVNTVSPGIFVKEESAGYYRKNKDLCQRFSGITPLGRMGTAREIANVIAFLCSPEASFITGQDIVVDGGISLQAQPTLARKM